MILTCLGHSKFLLELENGMRIVTDPFDSKCGYPIHPLRADVVTVSHGHGDHSATDTVEGWTQVIDTEGVHTLGDQVTVRSIPSFHDDCGGQKRGKNLIHCLDAEGMHVVHLGDLGHVLSEDQAEQIGPVDILMIPVGGYYTIDAAQAREVCTVLAPRIILPMHYKTEYNRDWPIAGPEPFLELFPGKAEELDLLRVVREDLACQMHVALLKAQV